MQNVKLLSIDLKSGEANINCPIDAIDKIESEIKSLGFKVKK
tara:strand:- start:269 stop:394 length:126 start_codon:yes stop_codon:yes gene_type:complete